MLVKLFSIGEEGGDRRLKQLEERLALSESMFTDYREENALLKAELRQLQVRMFITVLIVHFCNAGSDEPRYVLGNEAVERQTARRGNTL